MQSTISKKERQAVANLSEKQYHSTVMEIMITLADSTQIEQYAQIPISFTVTHAYEVQLQQSGLGGITLTEQEVHPSYMKEYDLVESPLDWPTHFDLTPWCFAFAWHANELIGGAVFVAHSPEIDMLEGREDLALLWDIRIKPAYRRQGVGRHLFHQFEEWARAQGCRQLKVETQNINVGACRFYAQNGCELGAIRRFAYRDFPDEVMMLWYKTLLPHDSAK